MGFLDGECARQISLGILAKRDWEKDDTFQLILEDAEGGVTFNPNDDGGKEHCVLTVAPPRLPPYPQEGANAALAGARRPRDLARVLTEDGPTKAVKKEKSHKKVQKAKKDRPDNSATSSTRPHR